MNSRFNLSKGVIFSRRLLFEIGPYLKECTEENILTEHEDVEIGRCIFRKLGVSCTNSLDAKNLFFNNFKGKGTKSGYFENIKMVDKRLGHGNHIQFNSAGIYRRQTGPKSNF